MSRELLASQKNHSGIVLDPRTKLAVLTTIAVFILGGSYEGVMQYYIIVLAAIPLLLLLSAGKWKGAVLYLLIFGGSLCLELFGLSYLTGVANFIAVAIVGLFLRFTPGIVMGYFVVTTTTVSEFVAAMERLHLPQQITIPMSVMFRFFPTVAEEWSAIGDAMRMRGVRFGGGKAGSILEYRMVPMMICSVYLLIFGGSLCLELFGLSYLTGVANFIAVAIVGLFLRFTPGIVMGYFVVTTTTVSEFVAAMERLHLPQQITIPMSVMFRFFPTVAEEWSAIGDAMRMRGVRFGGGKAGSILEYRMVPMMICSVKIGEELSAAALTRGLGGPVKRTNICKIWFRAQDIVLLLICLGAFAAQVYVWAARG